LLIARANIALPKLYNWTSENARWRSFSMERCSVERNNKVVY